jgi:tetratricopeptide (TPR) repeat protein
VRRILAICVLTISIFPLGNSALACLNGSDLADELGVKASAYALISGQFPKRSRKYSEIRLETYSKLLKTDPQNLDHLNDLAVALIRLGNFELALGHLESALKIKPTYYKTLANLSILHKKAGRFEQALHFQKKALSIKPTGHLGLGNYYLKMLEWRAKAQNQVPTKNFLGKPYSEAPVLSNAYAMHRRVRDTFHLPLIGLHYFYPEWPVELNVKTDLDKLIIADREFSDAFLVFGDQLYSQGALQTALKSYLRALQLGHPNEKVIEGRIKLIRGYWSKKNASVLWPSWMTHLMVKLELNSHTWLHDFQRAEGQLLRNNPNPSFEEVEKHLLEMGVRRNRGKHVGYFDVYHALHVYGILISLISATLLVRFIYLSASDARPKLLRGGLTIVSMIIGFAVANIIVYSLNAYFPFEEADLLSGELAGLLDYKTKNYIQGRMPTFTTAATISFIVYEIFRWRTE